MINYIIQVILFQVFFLAVYDFFLSKETFFTKNRWYLLATPILSFLLPFIKIPRFQKAVPQEIIISLPEIFLSPEKVIQETTWYQSVNYLDVLFYLGVVVFTVLFLLKLFKIINLIRSYEVIKKEKYKLVLIPNKAKAFSFFNYVFFGKDIPVSQQEKIIKHELVHSKQKHSLDLLFFEFLKIVMWFNPMIFIYQKRITLIHEYISDEVASKTIQKENYINNLLSNFFQVENISFVNQFYKQSFIKKRIIMIRKTQSKKMKQLKYLVLIPVLTSMLFYTSCSETIFKETVIPKKELQTMYFNMDGKLKESKGKKATYLDGYFGSAKHEDFPTEEVSYQKLSKEEREEFDAAKQKIDSFSSSRNRETFMSLKVFNYKNGRKVLVMIPDFERMREERKDVEGGPVSFMTIDQVPTFPGCEEGDKKCFSKMVQKHFIENFDKNLPNQLDLSSGKKRIFIGFKIDKEGNVVEIEARAPHPEIKKEVLRVMNTLPKMIPGEQDGEKVAVKYSIPFTILVE